jgi:hypothetical protein
VRPSSWVPDEEAVRVLVLVAVLGQLLVVAHLHNLAKTSSKAMSAGEDLRHLDDNTNRRHGLH